MYVFLGVPCKTTVKSEHKYVVLMRKVYITGSFFILLLPVGLYTNRDIQNLLSFN